MEGFAERRISNLIQAIEQSKERPLARLITGLGIRFVGEVAAQALAARFGSLEALAQASEADITAIDGIGPAIAASVTQFFAFEQNQALIAKLRAQGVRTDAAPVQRAAASAALAGQVFVFTGTLPSMTREQAAELITSHGGKIAASVTKKTSFLVAGSEPGGSKYNKALELGIPLLDQAALLERVGATSAGQAPAAALEAQPSDGQLPMDL
jgi:DNA ligase (NAD+)